MRMIGPSLDDELDIPDPTLALLMGDCCEFRFNPNNFPTYITITIMNMIKMMQLMTYPPLVTASDDKFRTVMVSTMAAMINNMISSYM